MPVDTKDRSSLLKAIPLYRVLVEMLLAGRAPSKQVKKFLNGYMISSGRNVISRKARDIVSMMEMVVKEAGQYFVSIEASELKNVSEMLNEQYVRLASTVDLDEDKVVKVLTKADPKLLSPLLRATTLLLAEDLPDTLNSIAGEPVGLRFSLGLTRTVLPPGGVIVFGAYETKDRKMLSVTDVGTKRDDIYGMMLNNVAWALALSAKSPEDYISKVKAVANTLNGESFHKLNKKNVVSSSTRRSSLRKFLNEAFPGIPETWALRMISTKLLADVAYYSYKFYSDPVKTLSLYKNEFVLTGLAFTTPPLLGNKV